MMADWDTRFMYLARHVSMWSKDSSAKCGAVVVGSLNEILSQGYNGFPRGIADTDERWLDRDLKYKYVVHAEMNMIYNATLHGVSLLGSTVYVFGWVLGDRSYGYPLPICHECAKALIQVGVTRIVMNCDFNEGPERWRESNRMAEALFMESGVIRGTLKLQA